LTSLLPYGRRENLFSLAPIKGEEQKMINRRERRGRREELKCKDTKGTGFLEFWFFE
jgi:hypothetical protein